MLNFHQVFFSRFNIKSNGFISASPFIVQYILQIIGGWLSDMAIRSSYSPRIISIRKINTAIGVVVPAIFIVLAGYAGCDTTLAITFFVISAGFIAFSVPGSKTSVLDFAPSYSGVIFGVSNTIANFSGFLAPMVTGYLLSKENNLEQWQMAFWVSSIVYLPGFIVFQIFGTDQLQPWALEKKKEKSDIEMTQMTDVQ